MPRILLLLCSCWFPLVAGEAVRIYVIGDSQDRPEVHDAVCGAILEDMAGAAPGIGTVLVHTGDLTSNGDRAEAWNAQYFRADSRHARELEARVAVLPCRGNHDGDGTLFRRYFPRDYPDGTGCWYAARVGKDVLVVVLDLYADLSPGSPQHAWLAETLAGATAPWKLVVCHEPGWSAADPRGENKVVQQVVQPLAQRHGVALVLSGHRHLYARCRLDGVQHVTTGGAGGTEGVPGRHEPGLAAAAAGPHYVRIDCRGPHLSLVARSVEGELLDRVTLTRFRGLVITHPSRLAWSLVILWLASCAIAGVMALRAIAHSDSADCFRMTPSRWGLAVVLVLTAGVCASHLPWESTALGAPWIRWGLLLPAILACYLTLRLGTRRMRVAMLPSGVLVAMATTMEASTLF